MLVLKNEIRAGFRQKLEAVPLAQFGDWNRDLGAHLLKFAVDVAQMILDLSEEDGARKTRLKSRR